MYTMHASGHLAVHATKIALEKVVGQVQLGNDSGRISLFVHCIIACNYRHTVCCFLICLHVDTACILTGSRERQGLAIVLVSFNNFDNYIR